MLLTNKNDFFKVQCINEYSYVAGPRNCLGELLARTELFLFFAATLQVFHLSFPAEQGQPSLEPEVGINMSPKLHLLVAKQR